MKNIKLALFTMVILFNCSTVKSQSQDGGYEYIDYAIAQDIEARIRCNYTYDVDHQDNSITWNTQVVLVIWNNRNVDVRVDYMINHSSEQGRYCTNRWYGPKPSDLQANSKRVYCVPNTYSTSNPLAFIGYPTKIDPKEISYDINILADQAYEDFLNQGNAILSKSSLTSNDLDIAIDYYQRAYRSVSVRASTS